MKKFLSLVLALVMTMSLVTISAGAKEFTDDADITYDEAVAVISEVGVVDGYTDGKFNPTSGLTRGAAAKIICNLILGPTTAAELHADTAPYPDVPLSNTFSGYIAYCAKEGIISGYADGTFKPAAPLTGYAFMKMLLGALGYDSAYEGYTGANWSVNVAKQAIGIGLNKGLTEEFNGVDYVTREEAALYAFNTLKATMVGYENKITANVNGADVTISNTQAYPVTWSEGVNNDGNIKDDGFVQFAEEFFPKLVRKDDSTMFMEPANTWVYDKTEIGTYERYDLLVESYTTEVTGKDAYDLLGAGVIKDNELESYLDGDDNTITSANLVRSNDSKLTGTGNGVLTKVYLDTDKDLITIVSINTYLAQATADYSESKEYAPLKVYTGKDQTASYNVDVEDVANVVDVKNETFYQVTISYKDSTRGEIVTVAPAEVLEDSTVTKYSASDRGDGTGAVTKLTTGGEEYKANVKAFYDKDILNEYDENLLTDSTYNVYLDSNGYFIGVALFEGAKNYVFVTGYDRPTSNLSVKTADAAGIFLDGTMKQIKVNVKATNENIADAQKLAYGTPSYFTEWVAGGEYALNRWYTYTVDADGTYTLKPAVRMTATDYTADTTINTTNLRVSDNVKNVRGNVYGEDATVFLTVDLDEVDTTLPLPTTKRAITEVTGVYTGVQSVDLEIDPGTAIEEAEVYTVYDSDYFIIGAVVVGEGKGNAANIAYILDGAKSEEKKDDTYYWEFDCIMDGQVQTLTAKSKYLDTIRALRNDADGIVELRFDGDYVVNVKDVDDIYGNAHYTDSKFDTKDFDVYDVTRANELHLQGRTLYVTANQADMGLALKSDAKAVTIQTENTKTNVKTEFTSVSAAISHLADADTSTAGLQYKGRIIAALDSTGAATWVVFISDTPLNTGSQGGGSDTGANFTATSNIYDTGFATVSLTAKRPAYVAQGVALNYTFDVYVNGAPYGTGSGVIGAASNTGVTNWDNSTVFYYRPVKAGDKITVENFQFTNLPAQNYVLKIVDQNGNDLSSKLSNPTNWTVKGAGENKSIEIQTGAYAAGGSFNVTGVQNATTTTSLPLAGTVGGGAVTLQLTPDTKGYVVVTVDTSALNAYAGPWTIDAVTGTANPEVALSNYGIAGETVSLAITGASGITNGTNFNVSDSSTGIKVALSGTATQAYSYKVTIAGLGSAVVHDGTPVALDGGVIKVNNDINITKDMVSVSVVEQKMAVISGNWTGNTLTLRFSEAIGTGGNTASNYTWAVNGAGNTSSTNPVTAVVTGNTVTLTFSGDDLAANNQITVSAGIQGPTVGNAGASQTITLNANGSISIA